MSATLPLVGAVPHPNKLRTAKASLPNKVQEPGNLENWRQRVGKAVARCFELAGKSDKEACDLLNRTKAQISAWQSGAERPLFDAIFAVEELRVPLVLALSELAEPDGVQIEWNIRGQMRRKA